MAAFLAEQRLCRPAASLALAADTRTVLASAQPAAGGSGPLQDPRDVELLDAGRGLTAMTG